MNIATVFSGIGAPEYAIKEYFTNETMNIVFACDCGETKPMSHEESERLAKITDDRRRQKEVKNAYSILRNRHWVKEVYFKNYNISEDEWYDDIRFINGNIYKGKIDLYVGGSPCQSFSNMGKRKGLEDARGTLFYDYARLIKEMQPKVFIYENVPGMLTHDKGKTWETIKDIFESLNYKFFYSILNSADYGMPQNRKRLFVIGFKDEKCAEKFVFPEEAKLIKKASDFYEKNVDAKYYLGYKGFAFVTTHTGRSKINEDIIRTEKRNQQFNWNGDFIFEPLSAIKNKQAILKKAFVGDYMGKKGVIRKMTPLECHRLMGFKDDFEICDNDVQAYKQSGNSIVVDVMKRIIEQIFLTGAI